MNSQVDEIDLEIPLESPTRPSNIYQLPNSPTSDSSSGLVRSNSQLSLSDLPPGFSSRQLTFADGTSSDEDSSTDENVTSYDGVITINHSQKKSRSVDTLDDSESEGEKEFVASDYRVIATHLRAIVFVLFVGLCVALPLIVYSISQNNEEEWFEGTFTSISAKFIDNVEFQLTRKFSAVESLRVALTSHGSNMHNNQTWPFVTIPDWDLRGNNVRDLGGLLTIALHPMVTERNREDWENYVQDNLDWLWQAQDRFAGTEFPGHNHLRGKRMLDEEFSEDELTITEHHGQMIIKDIFGPNDHSANGFARATDGPFFPVWMHMPPAPEFINFNLLSCRTAGEAAAHTRATGEVTISRAKDEHEGAACRELEGYVASLIEGQHQGDESLTYEGDPVATMSFPVFNTFDKKNHKIVGILTSLIQFRELFATVLPGQDGGIIAVLSNTCGETFSYVINGEFAIFLGPGDLHDTLFDSYEQFYNFSDLAHSKDFSQIMQSQTLSEHFCAYSLRVYPTIDLFGQYITDQPLKYGLTMFVVIFCISCVFLTYDRVVQRRMNKILHNAKNSRAIVTSLFPATVRNRLLKQGKAEKTERLAPQKRMNSTNSRGSPNSSRRNSAQHSRRMSNEDVTKRVHYEGCGASRRSSSEARRNSNEARSTSVGRRNSVDFMPDIFPFSTAVHGVTNVVTGVGTIAGNLLLAPSKLRLKFFLRENNPYNCFVESYRTERTDEDGQSEKPLADLFLHCTVLFADISGFTAWSSEREPEQVFMLLQAIFQAFDRLARKRSVFKVETIGDCYVAVTGLPDPQADHAIRMTKFARSCMQKVTEITQELEVSLGPGTGNLRMRFGLHSGPVTAGVLRGEKSRFQLFGDTVNTASRMESTGLRNRIQISQQTADLIMEGGKENWIAPRRDLVEVKGKGKIKTFWVLTRRQHIRTDARNSGRPKYIPLSTIHIDTVHDDDASEGGSVWGDDDEDFADSTNVIAFPQCRIQQHYDRLIDWQVELFSKLLKQIVAGRDYAREDILDVEDPSEIIKFSGPVYDEVAESIELPKFDPKAAKARARSSFGDLPLEVVSELRNYIRAISLKYRQNSFHNYAHASHVVQSANKLLARIVRPEDVNYHRKSVKAIASDLHDYTFGITSDPLTHFAILFATLIHDVDHTGVSNAQRSIEEPQLSTRYRDKSVAEQNSVDMAWSELMLPEYSNLQRCIFVTLAELKRFRQLVVNLVMATDIFEKDMKATRNARWDKVFHSNIGSSLDDIEFTNMKATIVIEHIIQAADVSHTMQHWEVYKRWNERLFQEMYLAYEEGRSTNDPSEGWYNGELWFFDNYVIPLGKKLEECGVFGVASDECLTYALENRKEWARKGGKIVKDMVVRFQTSKKCKNKFTLTSSNPSNPMQTHHDRYEDLAMSTAKTSGTSESHESKDSYGSRDFDHDLDDDESIVDA